MSDHSKFLAEQAWARFDDSNSRILSDVQHLDEVLAKHEASRFKAWIDSISDPYDDGDED